MVTSSRTYYSVKDFANSSGHTRQKNRASQALHLACQVLSNALSERTAPGLRTAHHETPHRSTQGRGAHGPPRGRHGCAKAAGGGVWETDEGFVMLASIFKVMCHLHHTRFHFPVVCRLLAKVFQAPLEGKKNAEVNSMHFYWP